MSKRSALLDWLVNASGPLKQITTGNGYNNTVSLVERGQRDIGDLNDSDYPCLFVIAPDESRKNITVNQFDAELTVQIIGGVKLASGTTGLQTLLDGLISDVTKAVETDRTQGGRVYNTMVKRIQTDHGDIDPLGACVLDVIFKYATEGTNP